MNDYDDSKERALAIRVLKPLLGIEAFETSDSYIDNNGKRILMQVGQYNHDLTYSYYEDGIDKGAPIELQKFNKHKNNYFDKSTSYIEVLVEKTFRYFMTNWHGIYIAFEADYSSDDYKLTGRFIIITANIIQDFIKEHQKNFTVKDIIEYISCGYSNADPQQKIIFKIPKEYCKFYKIKDLNKETFEKKDIENITDFILNNNITNITNTFNIIRVLPDTLNKYWKNPKSRNYSLSYNWKLMESLVFQQYDYNTLKEIPNTYYKISHNNFFKIEEYLNNHSYNCKFTKSGNKYYIIPEAFIKSIIN